MRALRASGPGIRIVFAVLFGFMSLAHGPVMAIAKDKAPQTQHQPAGAHAHHHGAQQTQHHQQMMPAAEHSHHTATASICYSAGCFIALAPLPVAAPASIPAPMAQLQPGLARVIVPAPPEPSDPPPRLQI